MVISYPIPPYSNVPINAVYYQPSAFVISGIELGQTTTVTTEENHNYVIGQEIRLIIPLLCGCRQLNHKTGFVVWIPNPNQVIVNIYSLGSNAFKSVANGTQPQIIAIGDVNTGFINVNGNAPIYPSIPGSFINISPQ